MVRNQRDEPETLIAFTSYVVDRDMDCDGLVGVVADTFATHCKDLADRGQLLDTHAA